MKQEKGLVSVITIFFNAEKFIEESIESVLNQTYTNWELLLVDDGSTDKSTEIAKRYSSEFPGKIIYCEHPNHQNKGMSSARNLGIDHAKGDFVCFLDADDIWMPEKLTEQTAIMINNPDVKMLYGNTIYWWTWEKGSTKRDVIPPLGIKPNSIISPPDLLPLYLIVSAAVPATCSIMCRREIFERIRFEEAFTGLYEDQVFYFKLCLSEKVYVSDKIWDKYRQHNKSSCYTAEKSGQLYTSRVNFLIWLWKYIKLKEIDNTKLILAISEEFWKNRFLEKINTSKSVGIFRWAIKWVFRVENYIFPEKWRLFFWQRSHSHSFLANVSKILI